MPNHVVNELIFRVNPETQAKILEKVTKDGMVDFEVLVPSPLNVWKGNTGKRHTEAFKVSQLDWNRDNWGTKWNAYGHDDDYKSIVQTEDTLILTFQTAWGPPWPWLAAVFNFLGVSFDHNWMSEGSDEGHADKFLIEERESMIGEPWKESIADEAMKKHLHLLLWGVEEFDEDEE